MASLLVVEDDQDLADALREALQLDGHETRVGQNGEEGLRLLGERLPDLVLLDIDMPILDGPGMAMRMVLDDHGMEALPIVVLSGVPNLGQIARRIGTPYFLSKPCRFDRLEALIARVLSEQRDLRQ